MVMTTSAVTRRILPTSPFNVPVAPIIEDFELGARVTHDQYGLGRIVGVEEDIAVTVDFGSRQERICRPYAKLSNL